jgi:hypothetical protein
VSRSLLLTRYEDGWGARTKKPRFQS